MLSHSPLVPENTHTPRSLSVPSPSSEGAPKDRSHQPVSHPLESCTPGREGHPSPAHETAVGSRAWHPCTLGLLPQRLSPGLLHPRAPSPGGKGEADPGTASRTSIAPTAAMPSGQAPASSDAGALFPRADPASRHCSSGCARPPLPSRPRLPGKHGSHPKPAQP